VPDPAQDPHSHRLRAMSGFDQRETTAEEVRRARRSYYAAVSYIDDQIGTIRERLETLGLAEDTVIIVTSDHGDMLGEKGLWFKMSPYEQSSRVPMIIRGPEHLVPQGRFANPVSLLDLMPTLLELAEAEQDSGVENGKTEVHHSEASSRRGLSLLESARRERSGITGPEDRDVLIEYLAEATLRPQLTLVRGRYKLVICPGDPDQLFDLVTDPNELGSVAGAPEHAETVRSMRAALEAQYDLDGLEAEVLTSQARRRLVAAALQRGTVRHWDFEPDPEQRYVRGDFWGALAFGQIRSADSR
ncbi:MAG: sulfatase-like hydrolase/transferase, partial [Brachybacterium sp.]|nr:sulfatase-like hydrolase/transferase [Brachybacterium sp.]